MPTPRNLLLYAIALIVIAFIVTRIPGVTLQWLSHDHDHEDSIALGTVVWPGYEPLYLARKTGMLGDGVVNLLEYSSSTQVMRSFANGTIDAAALTLDEVLTLRDAGVEAVVVLVMDFSSGGDAIVAKPEFRNLQSLKGRRIAAESTSLGALVLSRALEIHSMDTRDVEIVPSEIDEHETLVERGEVDAVVTFSPGLQRLKSLGMVEVFSSREIPGEIVDVMVVQPHIVDEHLDELVLLLEGWFDALELIENEPERSAGLMAPRLGVSPDEVLESLELLVLPGIEDNLDYLSGEQPKLATTAGTVIQLMAESGMLTGDQDVSTLLSDRAVRAQLAGTEP